MVMDKTMEVRFRGLLYTPRLGVKFPKIHDRHFRTKPQTINVAIT